MLAALDFPVVSGNVSLYNETNGTGIMPTPAIGGVGVIKDYADAIGNGFTEIGASAFVIGETLGALGCSLYQRDILANKDIVAPPVVDLAAERKHGTFVRTAIAEKLISAAHDVSDGGLLVAVTEMCLRHGLGLTSPHQGDAAHWFGEDQARYVVQVNAEQRDAFIAKAAADGIYIEELGQIGGSDLTIGTSIHISIEEVHQINQNWLPALMSGDNA
jgi:phosphoribosylformylglycinamidine (FGAM) synthase-like enzyme